MPKGLQRSIHRGPGVRQDLQNFALPFSTTITITDGAPGFASLVLTDLPEGNILYGGAVVNLTMTSLDANIIDAFDGDFALGMAPTVAGALTGNEANLTPSTPLVTAVGAESTGNRAAGANAQNGTIFDNTDSTLEVNLNISLDDASISADGDVLVEGILFLAYTQLGDD